MSISTPKVTRSKINYPDSDGKPMAENTLQFQWIVTIKEGLDHVYHDRPNVFVAGDLLWYPAEGYPKIRQAPDALVAFGRPKGYRGSYMQWVEGGIPPQAVFEVLSPGNRAAELAQKFKFYEKYGVEEYYIYDPDRVKLTGFRRSEGRLAPIAEMKGSDQPAPGHPLRYVRARAGDLRPGWPAFPDLSGACRRPRPGKAGGAIAPPGSAIASPATWRPRGRGLSG